MDYYIIPIYGVTFNTSNFSKYKSSNINYNDHILYSDFNNRTSNFVYESTTITGALGGKSEYTICSTNIKGYHNSCGSDIPTNTVYNYDDNITINNLTSYSKIIYYEGYRELRYMTLTSDKYTIDENNNSINVGSDDDNTIINNLKLSWNGGKFKINNNNLEVYYNNTMLKKFTLERTNKSTNVITNPQTGVISFILLVLILSVSLISIITINHKNKKIINR